MASKPKQFEGRLYLGRDESGRPRYKWVGRFATEDERDKAVMRASIKHEDEVATAKLPAGERITVGQYADEYLERMESGSLLTKGGRPFKHSSIGTARGQLRAARGGQVGRAARPQAGGAPVRQHTVRARGR